MATRSIRPPLKHTPFTELLPDGTQFVTNSWYDWALNLQKAIETLRVIVGDPDGDGVVDEGGVDDVSSLLAAEVTVFARDMLPSVTGGCSALTAIEFDAGQPNVHALLFDPSTDESADFHVTLPFSWAGKSFKVLTYLTHEAGATAYGVTWEVAANCTGDDETILLDFPTGSFITESRVTVAGRLYITALSDAIPISRALNRDGDLCSLRIYRRTAHSGDGLDIDAALIAVRFVLADTLAEPVPTTDEDPYFEDVILLIQGSVPDTVWADVILSCSFDTDYADASPVGRVLTAAGGTSISTSSPKFGAGALYIATFGDTLTSPYSADLLLPGDFTIRCWVKTSTVTGVVAYVGTSNGGDPAWRLGFAGAGIAHFQWYYSSGSGTNHVEGTTAICNGSWHHVEVTRIGDVFRIFVDGTQEGSIITQAGVIGAATGTPTLSIGSYPNASAPLLGRVDDLEITLGTARHTVSFSLPGVPNSQDGLAPILQDRSSYGDTATITNYAAFDDAHPVFGANSIKRSTIAAAVSAFSSTGATSRFGRTTGDIFTVECWVYIGVVEVFVPSGFFFSLVDSLGNPIYQVGTYGGTSGVGASSTKLYYSQGSDTPQQSVNISVGMHFVQFNIESDNSWTLDLDGVPAYSGTNIYGIGFAGGFNFLVGSYIVTGNTTAPTTQVWVTPLRMTKGVSRPRGSVPTVPFFTADDVIPESGPAVSARWYESNAYTLISDRVSPDPTGLNCIANFTSATDEVGIAHVSSADGTNAQVTRTGKVYLEFRTGANYGNFIGVLANSGFTAGFPTTRNPFGTTGYYCIHNIDYRGKSIGLITNGTASANSSYDWDPADVIGMAIDWDTGKVWFNKNTVWFSGDPAAGTSPTFTLPSGAFTIVGGAYVLSGAIQVLDLRARSGTTLLLPPTGFSWYA